MFNKVILAGNLTRDIEIRYTQSGTPIGNTAIASTKKFKSQTGEQREDTMFIDIVFFGRTAEIANQYLKKGSKVLVEGRLKLDQWTAQDGSKRSKHSVHVEGMTMLGGSNSGNQGQDSNSHYGNGAGQQQTQPQSQGGYSQPPQNAAPQGYAAPTAQPQQPAQPSQQQNATVPEIDISSDEIPF